jgi:hypothetical protein
MTRGAYYALSGLYGLMALLTQGVALGWYIPPLRGLGEPCPPRGSMTARCRRTYKDLTSRKDEWM